MLLALWTFRTSCFSTEKEIAPEMAEHKTNISNTTHHDVFVDEASSVPCRFQMWVFFCAGNSDVPDLFPGIIKLNVYWVDSWVVWSHCIAQVSWNTVFLKHDRTMAALKNLRNSMFWHFSNALFMKSQEQVWNANNSNIKTCWSGRRWRAAGWRWNTEF